MRWRSSVVAAAVAATFGFFPLYSSLGLLYVDPHNAGLPPSVWLVPRPIVWIFAVVAGAAFVIILADAARWRRLPALFWPGVAATLAFVIPALFGFEPVSGLVYGLGLLVWFCAANALLDVRHRVAWTTTASLATLLSSGALACALAVVLVVLHRPAALYAFHHGRAVGTFLNTNELAGYAIVLCATAIGCVMTSVSRALRGLAAVAFVSGALALLLTFSRSGFIGAFVAAVLLVFVLRPHPRVGGTVIAATIAVLVAAVVFDVHHNPAESLSRLAAWAAGWRTFELFPLTGVGAIAYYRTYPSVRPPDGPLLGTPISYDPHDIFLTLLAELGIVGVGLLAYAWWRWSVLYRSALRAPGSRHVLSRSIGAGIAGLWVISVFNTLSIVFAMWANFMALALVTAEDDGLDADL
jgi:hypothetical protein